MATYKLISSVTVGAGGAANIEFTSIPQTYTDLVLKLSLRQTGTATGYQFALRFNGSSSGYSRKLLYGDASSVASSGGSSETYVRIGFTESNSYTANTFTNTELYIPNYTSSNQKSFSSDSVTENNATESYLSIHSNLWSGTSAITSILVQELSGSSTNFAQYSTAYLYGIKNS